MLESLQYQHNCFVTLTYADEHIPVGNTLNPKHLQDWLKRLRKAIRPDLIRFYAVGEYGDQTQRPHYHAALFNIPTCDNAASLHRQPASRCCSICRLVQSTWPWGHVFLGTLETSSAQYVAGYVTKKMTSKDDPRLGGRHPEFARMSNRPGIGAGAMHELASQLMVFNLDTSEADVPSALRHGKRMLPLGRYLRRKLRLLIGKEAHAPESLKNKLSAEMLLLLENYEGAPLVPGHAQENLTQRIINATAQAVLNIEAREAIFKQRKKL